MPKRPLTEDAAGSASKQSRTESKRKSRPSAFVSPLEISVTKWKYVEQPDGTFSPETSTFHIRELTPPTWKNIFSQHAGSVFSNDVLLQTTDGARVPAHSLVLRIRIPYFEELLQIKPVSGDVNTRSPPTLIPLEWVDSQTLKEILQYTYFAKTAEQFADDDVPKIYAAALHMEWQELLGHCLEQFHQRLRIDNCLAWLEWGIENKEEVVKDRAANFAATYMELLYDSEESALEGLSTQAHLTILKSL